MAYMLKSDREPAQQQLSQASDKHPRVLVKELAAIASDELVELLQREQSESLWPSAIVPDQRRLIHTTVPHGTH